MFSEVVSVTVNGRTMTTNASWSGGGGWETFVLVELGEIGLNQGANEIVFEVTTNDNAASFNFDAIGLLANAELTFATGAA